MDIIESRLKEVHSSYPKDVAIWTVYDVPNPTLIAANYEKVCLDFCGLNIVVYTTGLFII
ncbi:MAG: hypothetical protein ACMUEM_02995 [Flavobacteriales bacterium AspAUS03]